MDDFFTTEPDGMTDRQKAHIAWEQIEMERFRKRTLWTLLAMLFLLPGWFLISMAFSGSFDHWGIQAGGIAFILMFLLPLIWFRIAQMQQEAGAFLNYNHEADDGSQIPIVVYVPPERWREWAGYASKPDPSITEMDSGIPRPSLYDDVDFHENYEDK